MPACMQDDVEKGLLSKMLIFPTMLESPQTVHFGDIFEKLKPNYLLARICLVNKITPITEIALIIGSTSGNDALMH